MHASQRDAQMEPIIMYLDIWGSLDIKPEVLAIPWEGRRNQTRTQRKENMYRGWAVKNGVQAYRSLPSRKEKTESLSSYTHAWLLVLLQHATGQNLNCPTKSEFIPVTSVSQFLTAQINNYSSSSRDSQRENRRGWTTDRGIHLERGLSGYGASGDTEGSLGCAGAGGRGCGWAMFMCYEYRWTDCGAGGYL